MIASSNVRNAFTVDVEDYYHVSAFEKDIDRSSWGEFQSRVEANTLKIADLLDQHQVQGTFYILGWVADRQPQLVRELHHRGHEIGSHSYWHRLVYSQTPDEFRDDLRRSRDVLQDIIGESVTSYRAPSFSITKQSLWALDILVEEGFRIDSSIFPVRHDRYGIADARRDIHTIDTAAGSIYEFPASVVRWTQMNLPVSGGGYFRLYPLAWTQYCLSRINCKDRRPFMFYVHPWEVDPAQPRMPVQSRLARWRHYVNLQSTYPKLGALLSRFRFGLVRDVVEDQVA